MNRIQKIFRGFPLQIQLFVLGLVLAVPLLVLNVYQFFVSDPSWRLMALLGFFYLFWCAVVIVALWRVCHYPFYTLANLVRSLHQGDYSQRLISYPKGHAIGYLHDEINTLADELQSNRMATVESVRRFQYLIDQLEIGVIAFGENRRATMLNASLARLYGKSPNQLVGQTVESLALKPLWDCESGRTVWLKIPNKNSRFLVHASYFREEGRRKRLFLLSDVNAPLRDEERAAWKRLIRVLGHELNNSLTPIISLSQSLKSRCKKMGGEPELQESTAEALDVITSRAKGMTRFVEDYAKLAKLPEPERKRFDLDERISQIVKFLGTPNVIYAKGAPCEVLFDPVQFEQMLINVVKNALESIPSEEGKVFISWEILNTDVKLFVDDNGPGIEQFENLFVPFFSTKPGGSGIGLVLCRQIAESNGGSIKLENKESKGCLVTIRLPLELEQD